MNSAIMNYFYDKVHIVFLQLAASILMVAGLSKVWAAFGVARVLATLDPVLDIQIRHLILTVGLLEVVIALFCFFSKRHTLSLWLVAWMSASFIVYRLGLWWVGSKKPCSCLGNLTDALHISPQVADIALKIMLAYLFIGSCSFLFRICCCSGKRTAVFPVC